MKARERRFGSPAQQRGGASGKGCPYGRAVVTPESQPHAGPCVLGKSPQLLTGSPSSHSFALKAPQAKLGTCATGSPSASQAASEGAGSRPHRCPAGFGEQAGSQAGPTGALRRPRTDPAPTCSSNPAPAPPAPRQPLSTASLPPPVTQEVTGLPKTEVACLPVSPAGPPSYRDKAFPTGAGPPLASSLNRPPLTHSFGPRCLLGPTLPPPRKWLLVTNYRCPGAERGRAALQDTHT